MPKTEEPKRRRSSSSTMSPEAFENRLINKAYKAVEKRIDSGEATAAELVHFLRQGSIREQLELEKLKKENSLLETKAEAIRSQEEVKELYSNAINAFRKYSGLPEEDDMDD